MSRQFVLIFYRILAGIPTKACISQFSRNLDLLKAHGISHMRISWAFVDSALPTDFSELKYRMKMTHPNSYGNFKTKISWVELLPARKK